jgi:hypothetical protein
MAARTGEVADPGTKTGFVVGADVRRLWKMKK